jgi:hypothetical protein
MTDPGSGIKEKCPFLNQKTVAQYIMNATILTTTDWWLFS